MDWGIFQKIVTTNIKFTKKWPRAIQGKFLMQFAELLREGFSIQQAFHFSKILFAPQGEVLQQMEEGMAQGHRMDEVLKQQRFSEVVCAQIFLAQQHGSLAQTLMVTGSFLIEQDRQEKAIRQALIYPSFLLVFVGIMFILMRQLLLPQIQAMVSPEMIEGNHFASSILYFFKEFPFLLLIGGVVFLTLFFVVRMYYSNCSMIERVKIVSRIPFLKQLVIQYYSFIYSREFAYFLNNGQSMQQMITQMKTEGNTALTKEIAAQLQQDLEKGITFAQSLKQIGMFKEELIWLIVQGELTNQLSFKLEQYAKKNLADLVQKIERYIQYVQPLLFIVVGICIVALYAVLLLPTLSILEGG